MKKFLSLLMAAMLLPLAMNAQLLGNQDIKVQKAPFALKTFNQRLTTPTRADLADNQMILGHYDTDDLADADNGLGITSLTGVRRLGTVLTPEEVDMFVGGKIVKFRVGLANATAISNVFVAPVSTTGSIGTLKVWSCSSNLAGWNEIELSTPYDINLNDGEGLFIGFDYRQTSSNYPISAVMVGDIYPTYLYYQNQWQNVGLESYGNLSIQCVVESDQFPDYFISISKLAANNYIKQGEDIEFSFATKNKGIASDVIAAGACTYDVFIDGELVTTISNPEPFSREELAMESAIPSTGLEVGHHTLTLVVNSLNGEPVENPVSISREFIIYQSSFDRQMHLIEELTSNSCTYCPLGAGLLHTLMNLRDDIAMVAIHGNQSSVDPSNTAQCDSLQNFMGLSGWPSAAFNRSVGLEDDKTIANGIGYYEEYHQQVAAVLSNFLDYLAEATPCFATVNINSTLDPDTRDAVITIDGNLTPDFDLMMGEDAKLNVFLSEDGLVYRQLNLGTWVSNYVHDHVFRLALGSVKGVQLNKVEGNKYCNTFEVNIPSDWNTDNMEVVAFISRPLANGASGVYNDMYVNQANKRKFGEFDEPTYLRGDVNDDSKVNIEDVTALINYLLTGDETGINLDAANCDEADNINIADVTTLINFLLSGNW